MSKKSNMENQYQGVLRQEKNRQKGIVVLLIILLVLLGTVAVGAGLYFIQTENKDKIYINYMESADKFLLAMNYNEAEIAYLKAIEAEPDRTEAYSRLASVYMAQERWDDARQLLLKGIGFTNSQVLAKTYQRVMIALSGTQDIVAGNMDDIVTASQDVTIDATIFDIAAGYTYTDYVKNYGQSVFVMENVQGGCDLNFEGYDGTLSYYNVPDNHYIYDAASHLPYATSKPNEISFSNLADVFGNYQGAVSYEKLQELFGQGIRLETDSSGQNTQVVIDYHHCTWFVESDANGNIVGNPKNRLVIPVSDKNSDEESGNRVSGYIINVLNGGGVQATIRFLKGGQYGSVEKEVSSKYDGNFDAKLPAGKYTVEIRATGFITSYEEIDVVDNTELSGLKFMLSPSLATGEIRIVLTWGTDPWDLDSHLEGRSSAGNSIHISYMDMEEPDVAKLDLDDRQSFGPETTTIYDGGGNYTFSVHDFSNGGNRVSEALANSGATVTIYTPDSDQPIVYTVPSGKGTLWTVCRIENGQITPINSIN